MFKYFIFLLIHKYYIFIECMRYGLWFQAILHDLSKFKIKNFVIGANYLKKGIYKKNGVNGNDNDYEYNYFCFFHNSKEKHHWQYWVTFDDDLKNIIATEIPLKYRKEMICDWKAAKRYYGGDVRDWYIKNKDKIILEKNTREWVEKNL